MTVQGMEILISCHSYREGSNLTFPAQTMDLLTRFRKGRAVIRFKLPSFLPNQTYCNAINMRETSLIHAMQKEKVPARFYFNLFNKKHFISALSEYSFSGWRIVKEFFTSPVLTLFTVYN